MFVSVSVSSVAPRSAGTASILHADLDAFYASVEQRDNTRLRGRPVLVGGGVILAASYEAKNRGVRTPMNQRQALRICPDAVVVEPRMAAYADASREVFDIFDDTTPLVEALSIDEAFLDVSGLHRIAGSPTDIASGLRARVSREVGLAITVGIARTKFLAKVASGVGKPDGLLVVEPDLELDFLHPLPVERLWGVGQVTADKLKRVGLHTVGDIADLDEATMVGLVGQAAGNKLHSLAHNRDPRVVTRSVRRRSIGSQQALGQTQRSSDEIESILHSVVDRVTNRMRVSRRVGRTIVVRFRFGDFKRATRSHTLDIATQDTEPILRAAIGLLRGLQPRIEKQGLTLIGLSVGNLDDADAVQLTFPFGGAAPELDAALDNVRSRFGAGAVSRASSIDGPEGFRVPLLPD